MKQFTVCVLQTTNSISITNLQLIYKERPCYSGKSTTPIKIITSHIFYLCSFSLICKKKIKISGKITGNELSKMNQS